MLTEKNTSLENIGEGVMNTLLSPEGLETDLNRLTEVTQDLYVNEKIRGLVTDIISSSFKLSELLERKGDPQGVARVIGIGRMGLLGKLDKGSRDFGENKEKVKKSVRALVAVIIVTLLNGVSDYVENGRNLEGLKIPEAFVGLLVWTGISSVVRQADLLISARETRQEVTSVLKEINGAIASSLKNLQD